MSREGRRRWGVLQTFVIGRQDNPMMKRLRIVQTPWFGVYLHFIFREDLDPIPHDHPWGFWRMVLRGGYSERYLPDPANGRQFIRRLRPLRPEFFPTSAAHRITEVLPGTVSLVVVGRKTRTWGFWAPKIAYDPNTDTFFLSGSGHRWVDYRDALGLRPTEGVSG